MLFFPRGRSQIRILVTVECGERGLGCVRVCVSEYLFVNRAGGGGAGLGSRGHPGSSSDRRGRDGVPPERALLGSLLGIFTPFGREAPRP